MMFRRVFPNGFPWALAPGWGWISCRPGWMRFRQWVLTKSPPKIASYKLIERITGKTGCSIPVDFREYCFYSSDAQTIHSQTGVAASSNKAFRFALTTPDVCFAAAAQLKRYTWSAPKQFLLALQCTRNVHTINP